MKKINYVVCATPRCGSTYFCSVLEGAGLLTKISPISNSYEAYNSNLSYKIYPQVRSLREIFSSLFDEIRLRNNVSGFKVHYHQLRGLYNVLLKSNKLCNCVYRRKNLFPEGTNFIWLIRRNRVRQAISYYIANETNIWTRTKKNRTVFGKDVPFSVIKIADFSSKIKLDNKHWKAFFKRNNISPLIIYYEDFIKDPDKYISSVASFLGVSLLKNVSIKSKFLKQSTSVNEAWERRYSGHKTLEFYFYLFHKFGFMEYVYSISFVFKNKCRACKRTIYLIKSILMLK